MTILRFKHSTNSTGVVQVTGGLVDALRAELYMYDDIVFLEDTPEEYPIGRKGRHALRWIAARVSASFLLKLDDDLYVRVPPLWQRISQLQRASVYWGFFDYSGIVVEEESSPHYLNLTKDPILGAEGVFPPYARGAALVLSLDLVRKIAEYESQGVLQRLKVEDASYGHFLFQLVILRATTVTIVDKDQDRFAMDAKCCTEQTHPNNCWAPLRADTWIVHHVDPETIRCMARVDAAQPSAGPEFPSLCGCVVTPPAHAGAPLQQGGLVEGPNGPTLDPEFAKTVLR